MGALVQPEYCAPILPYLPSPLLPLLSRSKFSHGFAEGLTAGFEVCEHVEAGAGRCEHNGIAGVRPQSRARRLRY